MKHMLQICPVTFLQESTKDSYPGFSNWVCYILKEIYSLRRKQELYEKGKIGKSLVYPKSSLPHTHIFV